MIYSDNHMGGACNSSRGNISLSKLTKIPSAETIQKVEAPPDIMSAIKENFVIA